MKHQPNHKLTIAIRAILWGIPLISASLTTTAIYAANNQNFSISPNALDQVLKQLAIQANISMSYNANELSSISSEGLKGNYSIEQALKMLLQPQNLEAVQLENGGYVIRNIKAANLQNATQKSEMTQQNPQNDDLAQLPMLSVTAEKPNSLITEGSNSYTAQATSASTGLALSLKETPQSISVITRQQMDDQNLKQLTDVANQVAGLTVSQGGNIGSDNSPIYARGKTVDNYLLDGVKLLNSYSSIFQSQDTAIFDRFEIVRGSTGLMTGSGTASASINMVRKKPLEDFKASVSSDFGSWNSYRVDGDVSTPLNQTGTIRGRAVVAYQDADSYIDRFDEKRKVAYGVVEADLTDKTKASLGVSYQNIDITGIARSGLPSFYTDSSRTQWKRSDSAAASWSYSNRTTTAYFADIEHQINTRWKVKAIASRTITDSDEVVGYAFSSGGINKQTGAGAMLYATRWDYKPTQDLFNATLNGQFDLFNQTHDIILGTTYTESKDKRPSYSGWNNAYTWDGTLNNIYDWDGNTPTRPETLIDGWSAENEKSQSFFVSTRLKIKDDLALLLGARVENWERVKQNYYQKDNRLQTTPREENGEVTPYIGITYDLTDHWSTYASYTTIFSPQNTKTITGDYIDPLTGISTELGIKGAFFENQLNLSAAVYQTKEDNKAIQIVGETAPDGSQAYRAESGTKSKGYELEATGKLTDHWQISTSFSRNLSEDKNGNALNTNIPSNLAKLFTSYKLPYFNEAITVGGGIRWQSEIFSDNVGPKGDQRFTQKQYSIVDVMARYKMSENLSTTLNINNLFDKKYYLTTNNSYYGAPLNFRVGLKYDW